MLRHLVEGETQWSIFLLNGSEWFAYGLLLVGAAAGFCLAIGYHTRTATIVSWVLWRSLFVRMPIISNGADSVIRNLLFWCMFLPLGARWSIDTGQQSVYSRSRISTLPGAALLLQVAFVYWFGVALKNDPVWRVTGTALQMALNIDEMVRPFGVWLRGHTELCRWMTFATLWVEALGPCVALLPFRHTAARITAVVCMVALHFGIALCFDLGPFPLVMACAWAAFLPSGFWEIVKTFCDWIANRFVWLKVFAQTAQVHFKIFTTWFNVASKNCARPCNYGLRPSLPVNIFAISCLSFTFAWNLRTTDFERHEKWFPRSLNSFAFMFGLDQCWSMFAPKPLQETGWFIFSAHLTDGSDVDFLREGKAISWEKPKQVHTLFRDHRWQKLLMNLWQERYCPHRRAFCDYLCHEWNAEHNGSRHVTGFEFYFMAEHSDVDGKVRPVEKLLLCKNERYWQ